MPPRPARRPVARPVAASLVALAAATLAGCAHSPAVSKEAAAGATPFRRVVTGLDASGRSAVVEDGPVPEAVRMSAATLPPDVLAAAPHLRHVLESDPIWFGALPVDAGAYADPLRGPLPGSDDGMTPKLPHAGFAAAIFRWAPGGPSFPMHASPTLDFGVIVSGAVELQLESGSTVLRAGDVVVQRGTRHTWKVVGDEPCVMFGILLDATGKAGAAASQR
jgi:quercetin dioxygenase-like cupin family protein